MKEQLKEVFRDLFPNYEQPEDITAENVAAWDSLTHLNLILALEEEFEVEINPSDIPKLYKDFATILDYIKQYQQSLA